MLYTTTLTGPLGPVMLGTDYLFLSGNTRSVNAFIGMSFSIGKKKPQI